jgi:phage/plasmid-like protein (TIGR03299 family)
VSRETRETLNRFVLVGNCANRPMAWHNDPELRRRKGWANNHFDDYIPMDTVIERLFDWEPQAVPKANLIPCEQKDANFFGPQGQPYRVSLTTGFDEAGNIETGEQGIIRSDTKGHMATHSAGYRIHDYKEWLLGLQAKVIGKQKLSILGAGLLRNGLQAYVQVALPETVHDDSTGMAFVPFMMVATSLDGSMPTTVTRQSLWVVCDNTRDQALRQSEQSGMIFTAKHTARSLDWEKIQEVRNAMRILVKTAEDIVSETRELAAIPVNRRQWIKVMDIIMPMPKVEDKPTKQTIGRAKSRRELLHHTYLRDPMCRDYKDTALGVVHAANTYWTHYRTVHGDRFDRNMDKVIRGDVGKFDRATVLALSQVLNRPELIAVS